MKSPIFPPKFKLKYFWKHGETPIIPPLFLGVFGKLKYKIAGPYEQSIGKCLNISFLVNYFQMRI